MGTPKGDALNGESKSTPSSKEEGYAKKANPRPELFPRETERGGVGKKRKRAELRTVHNPGCA